MKHATAAGPFVQVVDILGDDPHLEHLLQPCKGIMPRIGLRSEEFAPTGIVKPDHPLPMPFQRLGRTHILYSIIRPQTVRIAECGDAAFGTDTGTGKNHQSTSYSEPCRKHLRNALEGTATVGLEAVRIGTGRHHRRRREGVPRFSNLLRFAPRRTFRRPLPLSFSGGQRSNILCTKSERAARHACVSSSRHTL